MTTLRVAHESESAAVARRSVSAAFTEAGLSADQAFEAALIASELVGNAVRHAEPLPSGQLILEWSFEDGHYLISVTDGGNVDSLTPQTAEVTDTSGRGLMIVQALSSSWGVRNSDGTTTVWARFAVPAAESADRMNGANPRDARRPVTSGPARHAAG